jgi:Tfp pilus assembly protein PilP
MGDVLAFQDAAVAQTPPVAAVPASPAPPAVPDSYAYQADGRRDPFINLLGTGAPPVTSRRGEGVAGLATAEMSVRGVMQSGDSLVALVQGPDNRSYIVKSGDRLVDGIVKSVTQQGLIVVQNVNDPLSLEKTREVRRLLRTLEDAK